MYSIQLSGQKGKLKKKTIIKDRKNKLHSFRGVRTGVGGYESRVKRPVNNY